MQAITACHNDVRQHLGVEGSLDLLKDRFHWPNMAAKLKVTLENVGGV